MQRITSKLSGVLFTVLLCAAAVTTASLHKTRNVTAQHSVSVSSRPSEEALTLSRRNPGFKRPAVERTMGPLTSETLGTACSQWDVTGVWTFVQTNGTSPEFTLLLTDNGLKGSAVYWYEYNDSGYYFPRRASVDGTIKGDSLELTAYWDNGITGVYTAKVGAIPSLKSPTLMESSVIAFTP